MHCSKCCPSPPLSPGQREYFGRLLGNPKPAHELMKWRLRFYCGHVVERTAHYTHKTVQAAFTGLTSCQECGLDPTTIVDGEAVGLAGEPHNAHPGVSSAHKKTSARRLTKADLEARVRELEAEVERLRSE